MYALKIVTSVITVILMFIGLSDVAVAAVGFDASGTLVAEYYIYGQHEEVTVAFQRLADFYGAEGGNAISGMALALGLVSLLVAALGMYSRGLLGNQVQPMSLFLPLTAGTLLFFALIVPKGKIIIYDQGHNYWSEVNGVPHGLLVAAGITNSIERMGIEIATDTAALVPVVSGSTVSYDTLTNLLGATEYGRSGQGQIYALLYALNAEFNEIPNTYITRSLRHYIKECAPPLADSVNWQTIKRGTYDLMGALSVFRSPAFFVTLYVDGSGAPVFGGNTVTCAAAHPILSAALSASADAESQEVLKNVCVKVGYDANNVDRLNNCKTLIGDWSVVLYDSPTGGLAGATQTAKNSYIAGVLGTTLAEIAPEVAQEQLANRNLMVQSMGFANTLNEWMPQLRMFILTMLLAVLPIVSVFIMTTVFARALVIIVAAFGWYAIWGIMDAYFWTIATDKAIYLYYAQQSFQQGLDSLWLTPDASQKALALLGKLQGSAFALSAALMALLFRVSMYHLSSIGEREISHVGQQGSHTAQQTMTPEGRGALLNSVAQGAATQRTVETAGFSGYADSMALNQAANVVSDQRVMAGHGGFDATLEKMSNAATARKGVDMGGGDKLHSLLQDKAGPDGNLVKTADLHGATNQTRHSATDLKQNALFREDVKATDQHQAMDDYALANHRPIQERVAHGSSESQADVNQALAERRVASEKTHMTGLADRHITPTQAGTAQGEKEISHDVGAVNLVNNTSARQRDEASTANQLEPTAQGSAKTTAARDYHEGNLWHYFHDKAAMSEGQALRNTEMAQDIADVLGMDVHEFAKTTGGTMTMNLSGDQLNTLAAAGVLPEEFAQNHSTGARIMRHEKLDGTAVTQTADSGFASHHRETATTDLNQGPEGIYTYQSMLSDQHEPLLANHIEAAWESAQRGDRQAWNKLAAFGGDTINQAMRATATGNLSDTQSASATAGFDSKNSPIGTLFGFVTGASAAANASTSIHNSESATLTSNEGFINANNALADAITRGHQNASGDEAWARAASYYRDSIQHQSRENAEDRHDNIVEDMEDKELKAVPDLPNYRRKE